jgi:hypothetical protein
LIILADQVIAGGFTATVHYSHAPRSVVLQAALSTRMDFTDIDPADPLVRAAAFFRRRVEDGAAVTTTSSIVAAAGLTEVHFELIADNCVAVAVVTESDTTGSFAGAPEEATDVRTVSFLRRVNGTTAYSHTVKVFPGGRPVGEQEAVDHATANAESFGLDLAELDIEVTADAVVRDELLDRDPRILGR